MGRSDSRHMDETLNLRSFYLRLVKKIWIIPLAALLGAIIAGGIYTLVTVTFGPAKTYSTESKLYIKFAYDENAKSQVDYYNAYTWSLLMTTDDILNEVMSNLEKAGVSEEDISRQEASDSVKAEIPSDVRLLLVTVENTDKDHADLITDATDKALENYGEINDAFTSIKLLSKSEAALVTYTDKTATAAAFGAVTLAVLTIFLLLTLDALDDAVYVPEDIEKRFDVKVLGVVGKNDIFRNELQAAFDKLISGAEKVIFISTDSYMDTEVSKKDLLALKESLGARFEEQVERMIPMETPGKVLENYRKIGTCDGVILGIPAGKKCGTMNEHIVTQLQKHECPILGIVLVRADEKFLKKYYRL
mgnify:CR=1 FL=1